MRDDECVNLVGVDFDDVCPFLAHRLAVWRQFVFGALVLGMLVLTEPCRRALICFWRQLTKTALSSP